MDVCIKVLVIQSLGEAMANSQWLQPLEQNIPKLLPLRAKGFFAKHLRPEGRFYLVCIPPVPEGTGYELLPLCGKKK